MGGPGSGRKRWKYATEEEYYESVKARSRKRAQLKRECLLARSPAEVRAEKAYKSRLRALRSTPEGRKKYLSEMRTKHWAYRLRGQLKQSSRARQIEIDRKGISTAWILAQFERQQGRCFYTGIPFEIVEDFRGMRRPSLDRIDSTRGYTRENTVLCLTAVNYLKNDYPAEDVIRLLLEIVDLHR